HLIPVERLSCEAAFYWRSVVEYVQSQGHEYDEQLDLIRPNCVEFCSYVKLFSKQLKECTDLEKMLDMEFIVEQLLQLLSMMDFSDTASRKAAEKLLHNLLVSDHVGPALVGPILPCLKILQTSTDALINYVAETISEIQEPITLVETKLSGEERLNLDKRIASIRVKVNELRQELSDCVEKQDFEKAAQLKTSISDLDAERSSLLEEAQPSVEEFRNTKNDPLTVLKCLTIICEFFISVNVNRWSPQLQGLMDNQILPGMINEEAEVRKVAVRAIGLCCHIKKGMVMQHLPVLLQATQMDTPLVRATALKSIFDIILIFGLDSFNGEDSYSQEKNPDAKQNKNGNEIAANASNASLFSNNSVHEHVEDSKMSMIPELRCVAAEGLSKLILSGRVVSAKLMSHLLLLWFNPLLEDDETLCQILGVFFPLFAFSSSENQQLVEEAFLPTLKTLTKAPATSPLSEINDVNMANFLIELTDARHLVENVKTNAVVTENPCHDSLAVKLCNEILSQSDSFAVKLWLRALNQLITSPYNISLQKDLFKMTEKIGMVVTEKQCLKLLEKFRDNISDVLDAYGEQGSEEKEAASCDSTESNVQFTENSEETAEKGQIPTDLSKSIFIALPKKPGATECELHRTISLMSHITNILLKIIMLRIRNKIKLEIAEEQCGFVEDKGTSNAIYILRTLIERTLEVQKDVYLCFIDYTKAFDRVRHDEIITQLKQLNIDGKDLRIIKTMYWEQTAAMKIKNKS
ncbi:condensin complex subunit 3, partial [Plakobranchus ocellatus]